MCMVIAVVPGPSISSNGDHNSVSIVVVVAVTAGTLLLIVLIIIFMIMLLHRVKKKSRKAYNYDKSVTIKLSSLWQLDVAANEDHNSLQQVHSIVDQSQCEYSDDAILSQGIWAGVDPAASRLQTVNELYISTKPESLDSILQQDNNRLDSILTSVDHDVTIIPNPSYTVTSNPSHIRTKSEQESNMIVYK